MRKEETRMKTFRLVMVSLLVLIGVVFLAGCANAAADTTELEFQFSCISPPEDACENHYGSASQQCASIDEKSLKKCPQSYEGHQAIGVCDVVIGPDIYVEWVPYVVPPAINPIGECENLLQGTWSDSYTP